MVKSVFSKMMGVGRATVFTVGLAMILAVVLGVATAALGAPKTIVLEARATAINDFVDVTGDGPSPGDIYVFKDELFDARNTSVKVGQAEGRCNLIDPAAGRFECTIVSSLQDGTITTDGILVNVPGATSVGSVTGGTGVYRGATGEGSLDLGPPEGPHTIRFVLRP
jgi:hypothetical protein